MLAWPFSAIIIGPGSYSYLPLNRSAALRGWNLLDSGIEQLKVGIPDWPVRLLSSGVVECEDEMWFVML